MNFNIDVRGGGASHPGTSEGDKLDVLVALPLDRVPFGAATSFDDLSDP
jgi:hypothetical protein